MSQSSSPKSGSKQPEYQDWLVPCNHCERGNVVSLHPDGSVWMNGKKLAPPRE